MKRVDRVPLLPRTLFRIASAGSGGTIVFFPDFGGSVFYARPLVAHLSGVATCIGTKLDRDLVTRTGAFDLTELCARFAADIHAADLPRPIHLAGFSFAGLLAFETARQLAAGGAAPETVWLFDSTAFHKIRRPLWTYLSPHEIAYAIRFAVRNRRRILGGQPAPDILHRYGQIRMNLSRHPEGHRQIIRMLYNALGPFRLTPWKDGRVILIRAADRNGARGVPDDLGWRLVAPACEVRTVETDHLGLLRDPACVAAIAAMMSAAFATVREGSDAI